MNRTVLVPVVAKAISTPSGRHTEVVVRVWRMKSTEAAVCRLTAAVMALTIWLGTHVARTTPSRMLQLLWLGLLPLSFLHLVVSGVLAL